MAYPPLDVSPLAVRLLDLAGRGATGRLQFGDRTLLLRDGEIADLLPADGDESLERHVIEHANLDGDLLQELSVRARERGTGLLQLLQQEGHLDRNALAEMRRALLSTRLARAIAVVEARAEPLPVLEPAPEASRGAAVELLTTVLDALSDRAAGAPEDAVGSQLNHRLEWHSSAQAEGAIAWADLGELPERPALSTILAKEPGARPRIAAVLRAGLASLSEPGGAAPPGPSRTGTLPPPPPRLSVVPSRPAAAAATMSVDPLAGLSARPPRLRLDPGHGQAAAEPLQPTRLSKLPRATIDLDDPLGVLEQRIAELESADAEATPAERARTFSKLADLWRERLGSPERACRWLREAAAADPTDVRLLEQTALHCHYLGQAELAARYALAAVQAATGPVERASAQRMRATLLRAAGDVEGFIEALCEAAADDPTSPEPHELVAAALLSRGNSDGANAHARLGAAAQPDTTPERASALLDFAWSSKPGDIPTSYEFASHLDAHQRRTGAVAVLAASARGSHDPDGRRKLRLAAAQRAEAAERPDMAAELLTAAFDAEPHFDLLYAPLEEDLLEVEPPELRAALLEDVATACPEQQRAHWLTRAGITTLEIGGQAEAACWLFYEAVLTQPDHGPALEALASHAHDQRTRMIRAHALRAHIAHALGSGRRADTALIALAELADGELDNAELARAAWTQLERLGQAPEGVGDTLTRLAERCEARKDALLDAEARLLGSPPERRAAAAIEVLINLPDLPEHWSQRLELLAELDTHGALTPEFAQEAEVLHSLSRDAVTLATFLDDAAERTRDDGDRVRLLRRLAAVHTVREDTAAVAATAERLLAVDPSDAIGHARLERSATKLGDNARLYRALTLRVDVASGVPRARLHARMARLAEAMGRDLEAAEHAAQALDIDARAADAAFVFLRTAHLLDPRQALERLPLVRDAVGPSRRLYLLWLQSARATGDVRAAAEVAADWSATLPSDAQARGALIAARALPDGSSDQTDLADVSHIERLCLESLTRLPFDEVFGAVRAVSRRLADRGAPLAAARLSIRLAHEQGQLDQALARHAVDLARRAADQSVTTQALELLVSRVDASERAQVLLEVAAHHRDYRDHLGEARALLRVLETEPTNEVALRQLEVLFRAAGDAQRVAAVSTLALEAEHDEEARRARLLDLIGLAALDLNDAARADFHLRQLIAESSDNSRWLRLALGVLFEMHDDREALSRCISIAEECPPDLGHRFYLWAAITAEQRLQDSDLACDIALEGSARHPSHAELLLTVERLTLAKDDVERAMLAYDALLEAAVGPHGRRALLYRAGRWLERSGRLNEALERYANAFEFAPTGGAALKAVERVARALGDHATLLRCYEQLAAEVGDATLRVELLCACADLCGDLERYERRLELLMEANALSEGFALDLRVHAAARELAILHPDRAEGAWRRVAAELRERVERLWDAAQKARCLVELARLTGIELKDPTTALARLDEAAKGLAQEESDDELVASVALTRAQVLSANDRISEARTWLRTAREIAPSLAGTSELARELGAPPPGELASTPVSVRTVVPTPVPSEAPTGAPSEKSLRAQLAQGDAAALVPLSRALLGRPEAAAEARSLLREACAAQPWNTAVMRALHDASTGPESAAERWVTGSLLSIFDNRVEAPEEIGVRPGFWRGVDVRAVIGQPWTAEIEGLLTRLWECAQTVKRYRNAPRDLGISERDRITRLTVGPVAEAYAVATRTLGTHDVPVYVALHSEELVSVLPTHPPTVVAARRVGDSLAALRYEMARGLWLAQPQFAIPAVLERQDAVDLLDAALAAFGRGSGPERLSSAATEITAALWQALPAGEQQGLERVLGGTDEPLDYDALRTQALDIAARAGLIASAALCEAVAYIAQHDPALATLDVAREEDFAKACKRSSALCSTVQCALSRDFLAALAAVL